MATLFNKLPGLELVLAQINPNKMHLYRKWKKKSSSIFFSREFSAFHHLMCTDDSRLAVYKIKLLDTRFINSKHLSKTSSIKDMATVPFSRKHLILKIISIRHRVIKMIVKKP
ncbi:hypothetical protein BpHYR1_006252 [Brachionus plicatilis]|uniref:Uncharacterized protein n=1 Tax=Brachionus plicatilis TaxID=10195 RepID=A0A3M7RB78_BRAPC|nr:hypothetical protein BpHYR1_006252 [Brachionus plicatilis]